MAAGAQVLINTLVPLALGAYQHTRASGINPLASTRSLPWPWVLINTRSCPSPRVLINTPVPLALPINTRVPLAQVLINTLVPLALGISLDIVRYTTLLFRV